MRLTKEELRYTNRSFFYQVSWVGDGSPIGTYYFTSKKEALEFVDMIKKYNFNETFNHRQQVKVERFQLRSKKPARFEDRLITTSEVVLVLEYRERK